MVNYETCNCGKKATWLYAPSTDSTENPFHCDDCVPRGCSCNSYHTDPNAYHPPLENPELPEGIENKDWHWKNKEKTEWCRLDDEGREYPCCEFWYDENGYEIEEK